MPKRNGAVAWTLEDFPQDVTGNTSMRRHKKHKHKKHKRKRGSSQEGELSPCGSLQSDGEGNKPSLKLKIRIGNKTLEKKVSKDEIPVPSSEDSEHIIVDEDVSSTVQLMPPAVRPGLKHQSADSDLDEEEAWIKALESGKLDEVDDELRKMKDPSLMTARQRALLESKASKDEQAAAASAVVEPQIEMTEEMIQRRIMRAKKRKQQAEEKREKDKKQTLERLLKKSDSKSKKKIRKKMDYPKISYINGLSGTLLSFPLGISFPMTPQGARTYPGALTCGVEGCCQLKKYSCSKTGVPLCSLECYKKNLFSRGYD